MKNKLLLLVLVLSLALPLAADVQNNFNGNAVSIINASGAPANPCTRVSTFYIDSSTGNFYVCKSAGSNWTMSGGGGGGALTPPVTISDTAANTDLSLINTTAATLGAAQSSPIFDIQGKYWSGASAADDWTVQNVLTNGLNGASVLTIGHAGTSGAASVSIAAALTVAGNIASGAGANINFSGRTRLLSPADGQFLLENNAQTAFTRMMFGGTTSSFPALKVSGTTLAARLADDSADAPFSASTLGLSGLFTANTGACNAISTQFGSTSTVGFGQGATTGQIGMTDGTLCRFSYVIGSAMTQRMGGAGILAWTSTAGDASGTIDTTLSRGSSGGHVQVGTTTNNSNGGLDAAGFFSKGTTFTGNAGCSETTLTGGATAGTFVAVSTSCTIIVTMGNSMTAPNGWACEVHDRTTAADYNNPRESATSTTTVTFITGTIVSSDVIFFSCTGY